MTDPLDKQTINNLVDGFTTSQKDTFHFFIGYAVDQGEFRIPVLWKWEWDLFTDEQQQLTIRVIHEILAMEKDG